MPLPSCARKKCFVQANAYASAKNTRFSCARAGGNVIGSRGSVIPVFLEQRRRGKITITDPRMTRFWLTLEQGVKFVVRSLQMHGVEIFVPKIPGMRLVDLAERIAPRCEVEYIRIRPEEKLHEVLLSEDESRQTVPD
jgi:UDP-N-acetylglucosamine 4,6-dehydratase